MLDKHTLNKAEMRPELRPKTRTFAAITAFVEELHVESLSNKLFNRVVGKGDAMDVGAVNVREPIGEEEEKYSGAEWAAWWSEETAQGQWQEAPHLDALGKGKGSKGGKGGKAWGKGNGGKGSDAKGGNKGYGTRPPLVCNRCHGTGHPERVCPTAAGSTSTTKCGCCQGVGHWTSACTSFGGGKFVPAHQRPKGGGKGASSLEEVGAWQQQQTPGSALAIAAPGQSMFSQWASQGPWMQAAGGPKICDSIGTVGGWKLKVINSMARVERAYAPEYAVEEEHVEEDSTVTVRRGTIQRCKNGRKTIRPAKIERYGDRSFDQWVKDEEGKERRTRARQVEDEGAHHPRAFAPEVCASHASFCSNDESNSCTVERRYIS